MSDDLDDVISLLARGGLDTRSIDGSKYDATADPAGAERLAKLLAEVVRPLAPSALVVWEDFEDIVLAHLVGLELEIGWIRCTSEAGSLVLNGRISTGTRVVFVTDAVRDRVPIDAIAETIQSAGAVLIATAAIVDSRAGPSLPTLEHATVIDGPPSPSS